MARRAAIARGLALVALALAAIGWGGWLVWYAVLDPGGRWWIGLIGGGVAGIGLLGAGSVAARLRGGRGRP